ncbi:MAG TPA: energy-coupling factor ABC transporter permease [Candidatus Brocadiales bacterium]|nr:energy-coupling factor ABC transporter permease [Candidatus Brocadiales bacterium]
MKKFLLIISAISTLLMLPRAVYAMHITEGILPPQWAILWFLVAAPFVAIGTYKIKKRRRVIPGYMPLIGMIGAAVFVFSCFPIPVIALNGMATAHPAGTGMSAIFLGPFVSVPVAGIALLIQALFLAHGGLTTLGGNIFSMGILGSFSGYFAFWSAKKLRLSPFWWGFFAGIISDIFTYLGTSIELGLLVVDKGDSFFKAAGEIFAAFMMTTQGPLCVMEGVVVGFVVSYVYKHRPAILAELGVMEGRASVQT